MAVGKIVAGGMLREGTPIDDYREEYGLWVKREDKACLPPGPQFSKTRGVYSRVKSRSEEFIGALDTRHSQAGHAVARACQILGKKCLNYYPEFKNCSRLRTPQIRSRELGAELIPLRAGRSAILYHMALKDCRARGGYMMPNALKLGESVSETAKEVPPTLFPVVLVPISSGTIAAGVIRGFCLNSSRQRPLFLLHLGYTRSHDEVRHYIEGVSGVQDIGKELVLVDEKYQYKDVARHGIIPPWPCNEYYDLKAFRWWLRSGKEIYKEALLWNIG